MLTISSSVPLGSKVVWLFGRVFSILLLVPPTISLIGGTCPPIVFCAVILFWSIVMYQMRGWSYGEANEDGIAYVSWFKCQKLQWQDVENISRSSMAIQAALSSGVRRSSKLLFNQIGIAVTPGARKRRVTRMEAIQAWWIASKQRDL